MTLLRQTSTARGRHGLKWFPCPCLDCTQRAAGAISVALHGFPPGSILTPQEAVPCCEHVASATPLWRHRSSAHLRIHSSFLVKCEFAASRRPRRAKSALSGFRTFGVAVGLVERRLLMSNAKPLRSATGMTLASKTEVI